MSNHKDSEEGAAFAALLLLVLFILAMLHKI